MRCKVICGLLLVIAGTSLAVPLEDSIPDGAMLLPAEEVKRIIMNVAAQSSSPAFERKREASDSSNSTVPPSSSGSNSSTTVPPGAGNNSSSSVRPMSGNSTYPECRLVPGQFGILPNETELLERINKLGILDEKVVNETKIAEQNSTLPLCTMEQFIKMNETFNEDLKNILAKYDKNGTVPELLKNDTHKHSRREAEPEPKKKTDKPHGEAVVVDDKKKHENSTGLPKVEDNMSGNITITNSTVSSTNTTSNSSSLGQHHHDHLNHKHNSTVPCNNATAHLNEKNETISKNETDKASNNATTTTTTSTTTAETTTAETTTTEAPSRFRRDVKAEGGAGGSGYGYEQPVQRHTYKAKPKGSYGVVAKVEEVPAPEVKADYAPPAEEPKAEEYAAPAKKEVEYSAPAQVKAPSYSEAPAEVKAPSYSAPARKQKKASYSAPVARKESYEAPAEKKESYSAPAPVRKPKPAPAPAVKSEGYSAPAKRARSGYAAVKKAEPKTEEVKTASYAAPAPAVKTRYNYAVRHSSY